MGLLQRFQPSGKRASRDSGACHCAISLTFFTSAWKRRRIGQVAMFPQSLLFVIWLQQGFIHGYWSRLQSPIERRRKKVNSFHHAQCFTFLTSRNIQPSFQTLSAQGEVATFSCALPVSNLIPNLQREEERRKEVRQVASIIFHGSLL